MPTSVAAAWAKARLSALSSASATTDAPSSAAMFMMCSHPIIPVPMTP